MRRYQRNRGKGAHFQERGRCAELRELSSNQAADLYDLMDVLSEDMRAIGVREDDTEDLVEKNDACGDP